MAEAMPFQGSRLNDLIRGFLEGYLQSQLKHSWATAAEAGIGLGYVGGLCKLTAGVTRVDNVVGLCEVRMVQDVEELGTQLQS